MSEASVDLSPAQKAAFTKKYNRFTEELKDSKNKILSWEKEISGIYDWLAIGTPEEASLTDTIKQLKSEIEAKNQASEHLLTEIKNAKNEITGSENEEGLLNEIISLRQNAKNNTKEIDLLHEQLEKAISKIDGEKAEDGTVVKAGYLEKIRSLDAEYQNSLDKGRALLKQIEDTLAAASNVELAKGFEIQKKKARWSKWLWGAGFTMAILAMSILGIYLFFTKTELGPIAELAVKEISGDSESSSASIALLWLISFLQKSILYIPLIWFAVKCSRNQSHAARLEAEYTHKEAVAITYNGHKNQIEEEGGEEGESLHALLSANLIETVSFNPSSTMEKDYHKRDSSLFSGILSKLIGKHSS